MSESAIDAPPPPSGCDHFSKSVDPEVWWRAHFVDAAGAIVDFFAGDGISLEDKRIADVGCGDGIIDLGVAVRAKPEQLVGFDILDNDVDLLQRRAAQHAGIETLPPNLYFSTSETTRLPAEDDSFDYVISWSAFEHIDDPVAVLREIRRILRPMGVLFIQLWPFYDSAHGTHLVDWFPEGFAQYRYDNAEILRRVRSTGSQDMASEMLEVYRTLNGITADGLQDALRQAGFRIVKVALDSEAVHIPVEAAHLPLSQVAISGIKLLAIAEDDEAGASAASDGGAASDGAGPAGTAGAGPAGTESAGAESAGSAMDGAVTGAARAQVGQTGAESDEAEGGELAV
ncbi:class I SAM-dependent methyltransferase [Jatrophihabitans lederbergiae]|uniref:Class I SAM-dependent methyltransferase n=1 Tax=Jatrophihabitans lederbergiae TaxID=3075547 RepID=A0ABU2J7U8_9ACTN|nr:class I SAM-dependent methyltransferase [Jatrophihabitans sp. DSM 44399]MDT0260348.1 class I SAM-dependent methyltransferase [Jatrophihabitans sp. DSM 44399]